MAIAGSVWTALETHTPLHYILSTLPCAHQPGPFVSIGTAGKAFQGLKWAEVPISVVHSWAPRGHTATYFSPAKTAHAVGMHSWAARSTTRAPAPLLSFPTKPSIFLCLVLSHCIHRAGSEGRLGHRGPCLRATGRPLCLYQEFWTLSEADSHLRVTWDCARGTLESTLLL